PQYRRSQQQGAAAVELSGAPVGSYGNGGGVHWNFSFGSNIGQQLNDNALAKSTLQGRELLFEYPNKNQPLSIHKRFTLYEEGYLLHGEVELTNNGKEPLLVSSAASLGAELGSNLVGRYNGSEPLQLAAYVNDKRLKEISDKLSQSAVPERTPGNSIPWAAL